MLDGTLEVSFMGVLGGVVVSGMVGSRFVRYFVRGMRIYFSQDHTCRVLKNVCVLLCFIKPILGNRYGPGVIPRGRGPGVAGSSPSTLTTSLTTPVPSSSSSNGPTTVPLITMGLCHGSSVSWVTFCNSVSQLKAQSSKDSFATF